MLKTLKIFLVLVTILAAAAPAWAQRSSRHYAGDSVFRLRLGVFEPDGESEYWTDKAIDFTGSATDFEDVIGGADYLHYLGGRLGLMLSVSGYTGEDTQAFRDFVDSFGDDIVHDTTLEIAALTAALRFDLASRSRPLVPYVGVGGGLYVWHLEEHGDFIDFFPDPPEIFFGTFEDDGEALGWFWLAGVGVNLSPRWGFFVEGRWHRVEDDLDEDFEGFGELDLGGREISAGFAWTF